LSAIEKNIAAINANISGAAEKRFSSGGGQTDYALYDNYIARLESALQEAETQRVRAETELEEARAVFTQAQAERKSIEKLKETQYREYRRSVFYEEEKAVDDAHGKKRE
jgi:flagellar FliJ protein